MFFGNKTKVFSVVFSVIVPALLALSVVLAATTIGTNIVTMGNVGIGVDTPVSRLTVKNSSPDASIGVEEFVSNGDFSSGTNWVFGDGWSYDAESEEADFAAGGTGTLSQDITIVAGEYYSIKYQIKNRSAGGVYVSVGGSGGSLYQQTDGNYEEVVQASDTTGLVITSATSDGYPYFNGSIDNIFVQKLTTNIPLISLLDQDGNLQTEIRVANGDLFIGQGAGNLDVGAANIGFGNGTLPHNTSGVYNLAFGQNALYGNTSGSRNTALGSDSLLLNVTGSNNVAVGNNSLLANNTGSNNTAVGQSSLGFNYFGSNNIALGYLAGGSNTGDNNVFIGNSAGQYNSDSNKLYIGSSYNSNLITGDFSTGTLGLGGANKLFIDSSGNVGIGTAEPDYMLDIQGGQLNASGGLCIDGDCKTAWSQVGGGERTASINLPLLSFWDCNPNVNPNVALSFTDGSDTKPYIHSVSPGALSVYIEFDADQGTPDTDQICSNVMVPEDYASGGYLRVRFAKGSDNEDNNERFFGYLTEYETYVQCDTSDLTGTSLQTVTLTDCDPAWTPGESLTTSLYVISDDVQTDDEIQLYGVEFVYTAE